MKRLLGLLLGVVFLFSLGCKRDSDVLVTFKDGTITRGDFHEWLDYNRIPKESILKKKSQQSSKLRKMTLDRLAAREAAKAGYDKREDYQYLYKLVEGNFYAGFIKNKKNEDTGFKEEIVKVSIIKLYVKNYDIKNNRRVKLSDAGIKMEVTQKVEKAKSIIKDLDSGKSFADLAKENSDDYSKKTGGDIGYISRSMKDSEFSKAAFDLKKGEYTKVPVVIANSVYIIKVDDRSEVTNDNIESVIGDKAKAARLEKSIARDKAKNFETKLMEASDVENHIDQAGSRNPNTLLFKIGTEEYKVSDLNKLISFLEKRRGGAKGKQPVIDDKVKQQIMFRLFSERLLMREAQKEGITKDPKFQKSLQEFKIYSLATAYVNDVIMEGVTVTPKEIVDEYNKNKDRLYTRKKKVGGKMVKSVMPLSEIRERLEFMLLNKMKSSKRKTWENDLLNNNGFKINESKLEGDK